MASNGVLNLSGSVGNLPTGTKSIIVPPITTANAVGQITDLQLNIGDNPINVPTGATAAVINLPATNVQIVKLKGAGGDTGITVNKGIWFVLSLDPSQSSFILNAAAPVPGVEISFL